MSEVQSTPHRRKGAAVLGARRPGEPGPFGIRPEDDVPPAPETPLEHEESAS